MTCSLGSPGLTCPDTVMGGCGVNFTATVRCLASGPEETGWGETA